MNNFTFCELTLPICKFFLYVLKSSSTFTKKIFHFSLFLLAFFRPGSLLHRRFLLRFLLLFCIVSHNNPVFALIQSKSLAIDRMSPFICGTR